MSDSKKEKSQGEIAMGAIGLWVPQSVGLAFLYAYNTAWFHTSYGDRAYITSMFEAMRGAVLGTPAAYGQAFAEFPFYTVLLGGGVLGMNALHQWKREPKELVLLSATAFFVVFALLSYQKFV